MNFYNGSFLEDGFDKHMSNYLGVEKFDVVMMNPPYQELKEGNKKSKPLWHLFVDKVVKTSIVEGGYIVAVHPDGWRNVGGKFKPTQELLKSKEMTFLKVHHQRDGIKTFGASIAYDFYCLRNRENVDFETNIEFLDDTSKMIDISKLEFIPNGMIEEFTSLMVKFNEKKVVVLRNSSYHHQRPHMSREQTEKFKYPCVYVTYKDGSINLWYSNIKSKGHFGIPKVIWSNGSGTTPIIDKDGEFGLTEFAYGIVDKNENLDKIKIAMDNPEFIKLMSFSDGNTGLGTYKYNTKIIETFRKDFWKEFI